MGWTSPWLLDNKARLLQDETLRQPLQSGADLQNTPTLRFAAPRQEALDLNGSSELEADILRAITDASDRGLNTPGAHC